MKMLVLGGTGWLSSHVARIALENGHQVTCVTRGTSPHVHSDVNGATWVTADRDHDDALTDLASQHWDVVVDVAREPGHVRRAVRDLRDSADKFVLVSTISVYESNDEPGAGETAARTTPLESDSMQSGAEYGAAKAACEDAVLESFGPAHAVIARPGLIGGPGDDTGRTTYWPWRFAHPALRDVVAVPDQLDRITAMIDVRDLAAWIVRAAMTETVGTFNLLGDPLTLAEHLEIAREVGTAEGGGHSDEPRPLVIPTPFLQEQGIAEWAGEGSLPLWLANDDFFHMENRDCTAARNAGLVLRPLADTLRDGAWWRSNNGGTAGLSDDQERELIAAWRASNN